ncbi:MAG: hypothetical protein HC770_03880 [Pseudanabaena sp. CRU_2_10]|nr:hypothetical protein [Pseudanabaena sp. CRU_2_10]
MAFKQEVRQEVKQLELDLWQAIATAENLPYTLNLSNLLQDLDRTILDLPLERQLEVGSQAIASIASIIQTRSRYLLEDWNGGIALLLPEDAFTGLLRQSLNLDLSQLIESAAEPAIARQKPSKQVDTISSTAQVVDKQEILQMLEAEVTQARSSIASIAYDEAISKWDAAIATSVQTTTGGLSVQTLARELKLTLGEVWLTLLLSDRHYQLEPMSAAAYCPADRLFVKQPEYL